MNVKGYLSTLIIILALFGISWEPTDVANQEIVVQFDDGEVTFNEAQNALATVKHQLQLIGVKNIKVVEAVEGQLKITYYSNVDVASVKQLLSESEELTIGTVSYNEDKNHPEFPSDNDSGNYELNICEIHKFVDFEVDINGYILEPTPVLDGTVNPVIYFGLTENNSHEIDRIDAIAYQLFSHIALLIDTSSYTFPEVRAGPLS